MTFCDAGTLLDNCAAQQFLKDIHTSGRKRGF